MIKRNVLFAKREFQKDYKLVALLIVLLGIFLRLYQIDYDFDVDELFTVNAVSGTFSHLIDVSIQDRNHPPLHNFVLFLWIKAFGNSEVSVRVVSVLASAVFLFFLHRVALRITTGFGALFVVLLGAISPFFVFYGQQARTYSLVTCFAILSVYLLMRSQEEPNAPRWKILYGISCAALVHSQYMGVADYRSPIGRDCSI
jgi:mannosyltransferase